MKKLIGITGYARSGKDTFFNRSKIFLEKEGMKANRIAFADALKLELDPLLKEKMGISAFTEDDYEKELIRPLLVTYGTELRRKVNPNCWIEGIQPSVIEALQDDEWVFVTDVRFENEAQWIRMNNGVLVHISRKDIGPANHQEHTQYVRMKKFFNYNVYWETYGNESINKCDEHVIPVMGHLVQSLPKFKQIF